jgi:hypothetical protein
MPKRVHIPPYIRDLEAERITEVKEKPFLPASFEENFSVNLPYTIPARSTFSFSYTFPIKPNEILLTKFYLQMFIDLVKLQRMRQIMTTIN